MQHSISKSTLIGFVKKESVSTKCTVIIYINSWHISAINYY